MVVFDSAVTRAFMWCGRRRLRQQAALRRAEDVCSSELDSLLHHCLLRLFLVLFLDRTVGRRDMKAGRERREDVEEVARDRFGPRPLCQAVAFKVRALTHVSHRVAIKCDHSTTILHCTVQLKQHCIQKMMILPNNQNIRLVVTTLQPCNRNGRGVEWTDIILHLLEMLI